jgi:hypothetical protein
MSRTFTSSRACHWVSPRQQMHASERYMRHGPIVPMEYDRPSILRRLRLASLFRRK